MNNAIDIFVKTYGATPGDKYQEWLKAGGTKPNPFGPDAAMSERDRDCKDKRNQPIPDAWKKPCKTCGERLGFQDNVAPYYIWCINNDCFEYHHAYTPVEWQGD